MEEIKYNIEANSEDSFDTNGISLNDDVLLLNINGYEGAIDLLLELAKRQKVDLLNISILELAEQYLQYVKNANSLNLEIASDYLVMAAWLAFLKSKILLLQSKCADCSIAWTPVSVLPEPFRIIFSFKRFEIFS